MAGLATWMASRNRDGDGGKIIWSMMQLMAVLVALMGGFLLFLAVNTKSPTPAIVSSGPSVPLTSSPQTPNRPNTAYPAPAAQSKTGTLRVTVVDAAGNPVEGANVTVTFFGKAPTSTTSTSVGMAPFGGGAMGTSFQVVVESPLGTGRASGALTSEDQPLTIKLPGIPAATNTQTNSQPAQPSSNPQSNQSDNAPITNGETRPADGSN